jgi:NitT/TauT family transport system ATP-binding protein
MPDQMTNDPTTSTTAPAASAGSADSPMAGSMDSREVVLEVRGLKKVYEGHGRSVEAIRRLTFDIPKGQLVCIVGPSGAGKTTLLRCIAGLLDTTAGDIVLDGEKVTGPPRGMAVVFQEYGRSLFPWMTVQQNVERPLIERKVPKAERRRIVAEALEAVGLADAQTRADLEDLVRALWHRLGVTVLFVTHDIDEAVYLGQRVLVLSNRPTVILEDVSVDLPDERDQLETRSAHRFAELRSHVYELIQKAKQGFRPDDEGDGT